MDGNLAASIMLAMLVPLHGIDSMLTRYIASSEHKRERAMHNIKR